MLEQGPGERKILEQALRTRMPIPDRIRDAPSLTLGLELFLAAWLDLNTCRSTGLVEGPIPWSEVENYGQLIGLDRDTIDDLHHHIRAMDNQYFKYREAQRDSG